MSFKHPFQKICHISNDHGRFILCASGSNIYSTSFESGLITSIWPASDQIDLLDTNGTRNEDGPPTKRQKTDAEAQNGSRESSISVDLVTEKPERPKGQRRKPKPETPPPNVSHLISTKDGTYVLAVTAEDKCVRVFRALENGRLESLSERCMPKRPCAIVLTADEANILVGDKFGDVYALPLHPSENWVKKVLEEKQTPQPFEPSASESTVHTKRNREALEQQRISKNLVKRKSGPDFEHKLVLGHVSLLTDLLAVQLPAKEGMGKARNYILTCDRDEHIRVSRGIPQTHVIEAYCLRHLDFISKLCVLPWQPDLLVSGSGGPSLKCYSWPTGEYLDNAFGLGDEVEEVMKARPLLKREATVEPRSLKIAVSGIWTLQASSSSHAGGFVIVAFEGLPALFTYRHHVGKPLSYHATIQLPSNILDVVALKDQDAIIVSLDTIHAPRSVKSARPKAEPAPQSFAAYMIKPSPNEGGQKNDDANDPLASLQWHESSKLVEGINKCMEQDESRPDIDVSKWESPESGTTNEKESSSLGSNRSRLYSNLGEFLYGLENLRKKSMDIMKQMEKEDEGEETLPADSSSLMEAS